jgi:hypothetical protein
MKNTLLAARILTWFNLVVWGGMLSLIVLYSLATGWMAMLVAAFLFCAIPLHSYAALKLQRSIRFSNIKLSHQTPVGVRFIGYVTMFLGISVVANGIMILQDPQAAMESMKPAMEQAKGLGAAEVHGYPRFMGIFPLLIGATAIVNVILNTRLLRWYYLVKQSDVS